MTDFCAQRDRALWPPVEPADIKRHETRGRAIRSASAHAAVRRLVEPLVDGLQAWRRRRREHDELLRLDEHMLHDIGLTRADVARITGRVPRDTRTLEFNDPLNRLVDTHFNR